MFDEGQATFVRVAVRLRALLDADWLGRTGRRFRDTARKVSEWATQRQLSPGELLDDGVVLGRRKIEGIASAEHAAAVKNYAEGENVRIEAELRKRTIESKTRQEEAQAAKLQAEAKLAKIRELDARLDLFLRLKQLGVAVHMDANGDMRIARVRENCEWHALEDVLIESSDVDAVIGTEEPDAANPNEPNPSEPT